MVKGLTTAILRAATSDDEVTEAVAAMANALGDAPVPTAELLALIEELGADLARARAELKAATRLREVLLASAAHDLRNPLNTFAMSAGLLRDDLGEPEIDRTRALALLSRMDRASHRMQGLIEDLVEASRVEAGAIDIVKKPEPAAGVVQAAMAKAKALVTEKGATLTEATISADLVIACDRQRTADALVKLIAVAFKSTGEGAALQLGAELIDAVPTITLRASAPRATTSMPLATDASRGGISFVIGRGLLAAQGATITSEATPEGPRTLIAFGD